MAAAALPAKQPAAPPVPATAMRAATPLHRELRCRPAVQRCGRRTGAWKTSPGSRLASTVFQDLCETCEGCTWKADASVLIIHRSTPGTQTVLLDPTTGADLFDASRLEFPFAAGPRVSLTALDCEGWGFEVNYFGIDGWSATNDIPAASLPSGTANLVVDSVTQVPLTDAHFESIARLYSTEVNFRKPLFGNLSFLAGFRWLEMTDQYLAEGTPPPRQTPCPKRS